jgi:restriction endonuclease Mrr
MSNQCVSNALSPEEILEKKHAARERIEEIKREKEQFQLERKKEKEDFDYRQAAKQKELEREKEDFDYRQAEKQKELEREKDRLVNFVCDLIKLHLDKLLLKKKQLVRVDDYGNEDVSPFVKELQYFFDKTIKTKIDIPYDKEELVWDTLVDLIFAYENNTPPKVKNLDEVSPIDFEHQCADLLNQTGWTARVTQASGDQGIDVIATYGNVKAVFQVKKYSQPVGNSAVQEIIAGKAFEQAHVAAVVTNSTFTASAKKLANATGVFLLHYSELLDFAEELGLVETE